MNSPTGLPDHKSTVVSEPPPAHFLIWLWRHMRRIIVFVVGSTVVLIGILMIIGPGPAVVVIPLGLAILATEFVWARRWLAYAYKHLDAMRAAASSKSPSQVVSAMPAKSRTETPTGYPRRQPVDEAHADWNVPFVGYEPLSYTADSVIRKQDAGADPSDITAVTRVLLTRTNRGDIPVLRDESNYPLNPLGRTGLKGRGRLWHWGRNQAADAVLTRLDPASERLQVLLIERKDNGQFALPGGMVDEGETMSQTAARELQEETGLTLNFDDTMIIFAGVVDDPRNTDNAWMETTVFHRHLAPGEVDLTKLNPGDDAASVAWHDINDELLSSMYASHGTYLALAKAKVVRS